MRHSWPAAVAALLLAGCGRTGPAARADSTVADSAAAPDSIPDERPDSVTVTPPDSAVMTLALLPPPPRTPLAGAAADIADRAVFIPRTQRWFMARVVDGVLAMDIGRIDGGVQSAAAFDAMVAARSPVQPGMTFTLHPRTGAESAQVTGFRLNGRRILALVGAARGVAGTGGIEGDAGADSARVPGAPPLVDDGAVPVEWRGTPAAPRRTTPAPACTPGDTAAISAAIARIVPVVSETRKEAVSVVRGCFGDFRALVSLRPLVVTTESTERVTLVRANGTVRSGRLRDLSYPLHTLLGVTDVDADGTHEIVVRSVRPAMETWAALRMTDSVTFTRFASGFTVEKR